MSKKRINATNCVKLIGATSLLSIGVGVSGSFIMSGLYPRDNISTLGCIAVSWFIPHSLILFAAVDSLREELGFRAPTKIVGNWAGIKLRRKIPVTSENSKKIIFMHALPFGSKSIPDESTELQTISIWYNEINYTLTLPDLEEFLFIAWRRQTQKKAPFSRRYWTQQRRPSLTTLEYNVRLKLLTTISGLIIDRSEARSGHLAISPRMALDLIQNTV